MASAYGKVGRMSSLIFYTDEQQALVATDTLAMSYDGKPFLYTTKAILVPHLHLLVCTTGVSGILTRWFLQINDGMLVRDVDHLNVHTPHTLDVLWRAYKEELAIPDDVTGTVYYFGFSVTERVIHAYAYRSVHQFRSETIPYGVGTRPVLPVAGTYDVPKDIKKMMDAQRAFQATRPREERVSIGGEIQIHHLTAKGCNVYTLDRFDDYEADERAIYENFRQSHSPDAS